MHAAATWTYKVHTGPFQAAQLLSVVPAVLITRETLAVLSPF